jgi:hypothetical protein
VVAVTVASCGGGEEQTRDGVAKDDYVRANARILASLPRFPAAHEVTRETAPDFAEDGGGARPVGYTTRVVYELPRRVPQRAVIDFYAARLPEWRSRVEYAPGVDVSRGESRPGAWSATFRRVRALVGVNTDNLIAPSGRRFEVTVDHRDDGA